MAEEYNNICIELIVCIGETFVYPSKSRTTAKKLIEKSEMISDSNLRFNGVKYK